MTDCAHCGLPLGRSSPRGAEGAPRYCCTGCFVASHLVGRNLAGSADRLKARVVVSAVLAMGVMVFSLALYGEFLPAAADADLDGESARALRGLFRLGALALSTPVVLLLGLPLVDAVITMRRWLSADALVAWGALAAWGLSVWKTFAGDGEVYFETATMVLVLYGLGRWLDVRARERARDLLGGVVGDAEQPAHQLDESGERDVPAAELRVGNRIRLRPGERAPVDGLVLSGQSFVDCASLTGEEEPRALVAGDRCLAGMSLVDGSLVVRVEAVSGSRVVDEIERLLDGALRRPARLVRIADRLAGALLPLVAVLAVGAAIVHGRAGGFERGLFTGLSVVLISCPCALGLATPLAFWVALGRAWRDGVLIRDGAVLERLARARSFYFDKTGTLTTGELRLAALALEPGTTAEEALRLAAALETGSEHPIGRALRHAARERLGDVRLPDVQAFRALPGIGVEGRIDGATCALRRSRSGEPSDAATVETQIELVRADRPLARFALAGAIRPEAARALRELRGLELSIEVLTGDGPGAAAHLERSLGVPVRAGLLPADKVAALTGPAGPGATGSGAIGRVFVGDGLNDTAALAAADVGIAVQGASQRSLEVADASLVSAGLDALPDLVRLARRAVGTARLNLLWAFSYNTVGLALAVSGRLTPVFAALAMVGSSALVVLHSGRLLGHREPAGRSLRPAPGDPSAGDPSAGDPSAGDPAVDPAAGERPAKVAPAALEAG